MTPQESKQKAIIEAYVKYGFTTEEIKKYVDPDGFTGKLDIPAGQYDMFDDYRTRPKSLQGINNNNGWTRIEHDGSNLPTEEGQYFVYSKVDWHPYYRIDIFSGRLSNSIHHVTGKPIFTHYQPIIKPQTPIY